MICDNFVHEHAPLHAILLLEFVSCYVMHCIECKKLANMPTQICFYHVMLILLSVKLSAQLVISHSCHHHIYMYPWSMVSEEGPHMSYSHREPCPTCVIPFSLYFSFCLLHFSSIFHFRQRASILFRQVQFWTFHLWKFAISV